MLPAHPTSGYCDLQGRRHVIEDFHSIHLYSSHQFYGMFDGHSGNLASKYAASTVYGKLVTQLSLEGAAVDKDWKAQVQANISQAFHEIHREFLLASSSSHMDQSGTTATALLVTEDVVVVAGLGDSRAVLSVENDGKSSALALTEDHVASDPIEKKLVEHRGGTISSSGGIPRVNGTLAITRSIGDENLASLLSREPHVMSMTREEIRIMCGKFDCFIVVASDGLWDVMSNQEAVDMVSQTVDAYDATDRVSWNNGGAYQEAAEVLALEAYVRGSTGKLVVCKLMFLRWVVCCRLSIHTISFRSGFSQCVPIVFCKCVPIVFCTLNLLWPLIERQYWSLCHRVGSMNSAFRRQRCRRPSVCSSVFQRRGARVTRKLPTCVEEDDAAASRVSREDNSEYSCIFCRAENILNCVCHKTLKKVKLICTFM